MKLQTLLLLVALAAGLNAQESRAPALSFLKSFKISAADASVIPPQGARQDGGASDKWNPHNPAPGEAPDEFYFPAQLVYAMPGALETRSGQFHFAYDELLGLNYKPGTLSFSGRGDSLFWQPQTGWGSEDINQDALPLLVRSDYQDIKTPCYEFVWQNQTNAPGVGNSIYLNYVFKVPKQSRTMRADELRTDRMYFDRSFPSDAPTVQNGRIFLWDSGSLQAYDSSLSTLTTPNGWDSLPSDFKATSFAVSRDQAFVVMSSANLTISGFRKGSSTPAWTLPGMGPVTINGNFAFAVTQDYSAIMAIRLSDGKAAALMALPRNLPRTPNSFATAVLGGRGCLMLFVPSQSQVLFYEIR